MEKNSSEERIADKLSSGAGQKKGTNTIVTIIVILVVIAVIAVTLVLLLSGNGDKSDRKAIVTADNIDEVVEELNKVGSGMYEVTMNTYWDFDKGDSASSNAYVENSTANTNDVYFDIVRSDTGENIYSSPIIPIGSHLEDITLDKSLTAGEYNCVLTYYLLDENEEPTSDLSINLTIRVHN